MLQKIGKTRLFTTVEPTLEELLDDPIMGLLMERDGVSVRELTDLMTDVRRRMLVDYALNAA